MPPQSPEEAAPLIPRKWRLLLALPVLLAALVWAAYAELSLANLIGFGTKDLRPGTEITLKPFLDPRFPDRFPWVDYNGSWPGYKNLFAAMALFGLGVLLIRDMPSKRRIQVPLPLEAGLVVILLLVAGFMRFHLGQTYPYGLHYDESTNAMIGRDFIREWEPETQKRIAELDQQIHERKEQLAAKLDEQAAATEEAAKRNLQAEIDRLRAEIRGMERHREDMAVPVFTTQGFGKATMHMYQIALAMKWFGTSIFTIRLPTMIAGLLGVLALYFLLRVLCDIPTAFLGAAFLAAMRWHVNFSRVAYDAIEAPLIITLTGVFFFLAFKHKDSPPKVQAESQEGRVPLIPWGWHLLKTAPIWLLAGYCFGLGVYSYKPLYLFPGVLAGFLAVRWVLQRHLLRWNVIGLILFLASAYWCASEMLEYRRTHPEAFSERLNMVSIVNSNEPLRPNWERVRDTLYTTLRMFHVRGDSNPRHNHPFAPMVHPLLAALFPLGAAWALACWRSRLGLFSLGWFVAMLLPGVLSIEAPQALRTLCVMPVIAIWSAVALREVGLAVMTLAEDWLPGRRWLAEPLRWCGYTLMALIAIVYWRGEYNLYFKDQVAKIDPYIHFDAKFVDMAHYVNNQKGKFYAVSDANGHNALRLLNPPGIWRNHLYLQQELPARYADDEDALYIVMEPWNRPDKNIWIEWLYPEVPREDPVDPFGNKIFAAYRVPVEVKKRHRGFSVQALSRDGSDTPQGEPITYPSLSLTPEEQPLQAPFKVRGKALWVIPEGQEGSYGFRAETIDHFTLLVDSEVVLEATPGAGVLEARKELLAGAHQVEFILESETYAQPTRAFYQPPGSSNWEEFRGERFHDRGMIPNGLRMTFWHGARRWDGKPLFVWVDPYINYRWNGPYRFPMSVEWNGFLECSKEGNYTIVTEAWDYALVEIDGKKVVESPSGGNQKNRPAPGTIELTEGKHPIRVRYTDNIGGGEALRLYWQVPGQGRALIPQSALSY